MFHHLGQISVLRRSQQVVGLVAVLCLSINVPAQITSTQERDLGIRNQHELQRQQQQEQQQRQQLERGADVRLSSRETHTSQTLPIEIPCFLIQHLPDGSSLKVLVPQVYVKVQQGDLDGSGALLAGKDVNLNLSGDLTNSGTIAGRNVVSLTAENVNNLGGRIGGNDVSVAARQDLNNIGGSIGAVNSLSANAGRDINIQTTTQTTATQTGIANNLRTGVNRVAGLYVSGANGILVASAGGDLNIVAGVVSNAGSGTTSLSAGNNFTLASVKTGEQNNIVWDGDNHLNYGNTQTVGSTINGGGNVNLKVGLA